MAHVWEAEAPPWEREPDLDDDQADWDGWVGDPPADGADDATGARVRAAALRCGLLTVEQLAKLPAPVPLVEDALHSNTLSVIFGKPGAGKTFVALDWALCVATSSRWQHSAVTGAPVLWIAAEGAEGLHKRIRAWQAERQVHDVPAGAFAVFPNAVNLFDAEQAAGLAQLVSEDRYGLVVVDTLARSTLGAEENSARDMGVVVERLEAVRRASGCCVLVIHHTSRGGDNLRGSSAVDGAAFTLWKTELEGDVIRLVNEKAKESARTQTIRLQLTPRLDSVVLRRPTTTADELTQGPLQLLCVLAEIDDGTGVAGGIWQRSCCQEGVAERSFYRWQKDLAATGFTANVGGGRQKRWTLTDLGKQAVEDRCD